MLRHLVLLSHFRLCIKKLQQVRLNIERKTLKHNLTLKHTEILIKIKTESFQKIINPKD